MDIHAITNRSVNENGHGVPTSTLSTAPFPASRKIYVTGAQPGIRVPMREVAFTPTKPIVEKWFFQYLSWTSLIDRR